MDNSECDGPYAVPVGKEELVWDFLTSGSLYVLCRSLVKYMWHMKLDICLFSQGFHNRKGYATLSYECWYSVGSYSDHYYTIK